MLPKSKDLIFEMYVNCEKSKESQYERKYEKITNVLSNLGGLFNVLYGIGCILCKPWSMINLNRKMLNRIFSF